MEVPTSNGNTSNVACAWPAGSRLHRSDTAPAGHLPFIEESEDFLGEYLNFLDAADGLKTSRELIIDPSLDALKSKSL